MRSRHGFTLIELMAAVVLFALMAMLIAPRVGSITSRALHQQAEQIAAQLELGRQRAIVTGVPHRLLIDLEGGRYRLEWLPGADPEEEVPPPRVLGRAFVPMSAPRAAARSFRPIPGQLGEFSRLETPVFFSGLETPEGWVEAGRVSIRFERDGTASASALHLEDESGKAVVLDVLPLADTVRVRDAE